MPTIGVRELRERTAEVIRQVREDRQEFMITLQGHPVALLLPVNTEVIEAEMVKVGKREVGNGWEVYRRLAEEVRRSMPEGVSSQSVLDEIRR